MNILKKITQTEYVRSAVEEKADLSAFKERPSMRIMTGIGLIIFSYIIGLPAVFAFGALSVYLEEPMVLMIGGPLIYGLSHLVFIFGMYLAGAKYTKIFIRWATRMAVERFMGENIHEKA